MSFMLEAAASPSTFSTIVQLVSALAWPSVALIVCWYQRKPITELLCSVAALAKSADKIKIWQVEVEKNLDKQLDKTAKRAERFDITDPSIHDTEKVAAEKIQTLIASVPSAEAKYDLAAKKIRSLAQEYESIRANMSAGADRTREMNSIVAQMRTFALAAKPMMEELSRSARSAGSRLAAVAMLQIAPDPAYFDWLALRMKEEQQPFILYHAALALLESAKSPILSKEIGLRIALERGLKTVLSYGGKPDQDTVDVLKTALARLPQAA